VSTEWKTTVSSNDNDRNESLRQFAATIQDKAAPARVPIHAVPDTHPNPVIEDVQSILSRQPRAAIVGVLVGVGVGLGYLLGILTRKSQQ
jgi:hypothetical protein